MIQTPHSANRDTQRKKDVKPAAGRYVEAVGRRKTSVARVRIFKGNGGIIVNDQDYAKYFPLERLRITVSGPLEKLKLTDKFDVRAKVSGGGVASQAGAVRHGMSRALIAFDPELKPRLRGFGFLTRDSRMVERKKYGLRKARRAPQWAKR